MTSMICERTVVTLFGNTVFACGKGKKFVILKVWMGNYHIVIRIGKNRITVRLVGLFHLLGSILSIGIGCVAMEICFVKILFFSQKIFCHVNTLSLAVIRAPKIINLLGHHNLDSLCFILALAFSKVNTKSEKLLIISGCYARIKSVASGEPDLSN